jgi:hypothetical protein
MKQLIDPRGGHTWRAIITACALIIPAVCALFGRALSVDQATRCRHCLPTIASIAPMIAVQITDHAVA